MIRPLPDAAAPPSSSGGGPIMPSGPPRRRRGRPPKPTHPQMLPIPTDPTHPLAVASAIIPAPTPPPTPTPRPPPPPPHLTPLQASVTVLAQQRQLKQAQARQRWRAAHAGADDCDDAYDDDDVGSGPQGRARKSLQTLAAQFMAQYREAADIDIERAAAALGAKKRRLYDITNVLEGLGLMHKTETGHVVWAPPHGPAAAAAAEAARPATGLERLGRAAQQVAAEDLRGAIAGLRHALAAAEHRTRVLQAYAHVHARDLLTLLGLPQTDIPRAALVRPIRPRTDAFAPPTPPAPATVGIAGSAAATASQPQPPPAPARVLVAISVPSSHATVSRALANLRPRARAPVAQQPQAPPLVPPPPRTRLRLPPLAGADGEPHPEDLPLFECPGSLVVAQLFPGDTAQALFDPWD